MFSRIIAWLRGPAAKPTPASFDRRAYLRAHGWTRLQHPPMVNNEWVWEHPQWMCKLESEAVQIQQSMEGLFDH